MKNPRVFRFFVALLFTVSCAAQANLTTLSIQFAPDAETFYEDEVVDVSATTDNGVSAEFRFLLQHYAEGAWQDVAQSGWGTTNSYSVSTALGDPDGGNYRLVVYARDADNPDEIMVNYQTFLLETQGMAVCDWLDGKTFISEGPTEQLDVSLTAATANSVSAPLDPHANKYGSMAFSGGEATLTFAEAFNVFFGLYSAPEPEGEGEQIPVDPISGPYACADDVVALSSVTGEFIYQFAGLLVPIEASGEALVDMEAGTLTANGIVFRLDNSGQPNTPEGSSASGAGGWLSLLVLCLFGTIRRRC